MNNWSVTAELEAAQRENRNLATEAFKLKGHEDELGETLKTLRSENRSLAQEIKDLQDQLGEGGRNVHELQKLVRRYEMEKDELQVGIVLDAVLVACSHISPTNWPVYMGQQHMGY